MTYYHIPKLSIVQLQQIVCLYELKSFKKASAACGVPSISNSIISLEAELGFRICDRNKMNTEIFTISGVQLYEAAKKILDILCNIDVIKIK